MGYVKITAVFVLDVHLHKLTSLY